MPKVLFLLCTFAIGTVAICTLSLALSWPGNMAQAQTGPMSGPDVDLAEVNNTGINLEQNNDYAKAIEFYNTDVAEKARRSGPFSRHLIAPLTGLARSHLAVGDYAAAQSSIRYAQHLTHRFDGVLSLSQQEAIDLLTQIYLHQGLPKLADKQQAFSLSLAERNFAPDSMALIPALTRITGWYQETGQLDKAGHSLQRSAKIIRAQAGGDDRRIIPYLVQQARIKRLQRACCGQDMLIQAIAIIESAPDTENQLVPHAENNTELKAWLYAELADAYTTADKQTQAENFYKLAWHNMTDSQRDVQFSQPQKIAMSKSLSRLGSSSANLYRHRIDPLGRRVTKHISSQEQSVQPDLPPQRFFLPLNNKNHIVRINDSYISTTTATDYFEMVGEPFQFIKKQIEYILPGQWQSREQLARLSIELTFTVNKTGKLSNIQISDSNSPMKLNRLMQQVLRKTRMRPRMIDGEPVETHMVRLNQTFK